MPAKEGERQQGFSEDDLQGVDAEQYYEKRKAFYQDDAIAKGYDAHRFSGARSSRNSAKWRAISKALARAGDVAEILDLPTGTGRFVTQLLESGLSLAGADISHAMMREAALKARGSSRRSSRAGTMLGFVQCDAEALPLRDASFDCVASIRFFMHLTPEVRVRVLREFARVSRRWLIVDYRHRHAPRNVLKRLAHRLGLRPPAPPRVSRAEMEAELTAAGWRVVEVYVVTPVFSDKWVVLASKQ